MTPGQLSLEDAEPVTLTDRQRDCLRCLAAHGPIDDLSALAAYTQGPFVRQSASGFRTRRSELAALGLVERTGDRVRTPSGGTAAVWQITSRGQSALR